MAPPEAADKDRRLADEENRPMASAAAAAGADAGGGFLVVVPIIAHPVEMPTTHRQSIPPSARNFSGSSGELKSRPDLQHTD